MNTRLYNGIRPALVGYYIDAMKRVYDAIRRVKQDQYPQFERVEHMLLERGLYPENYAITVARLWKYWCLERRLRCLPVNVFLGNKSVRWYEEYAMFGVDVVAPKVYRAKILADEYELARAVIRLVMNGEVVPERVLVGTMNLSPEWHQANAEGIRPRQEVASALAGIYGVECTTFDYVMLGDRIRHKRLRGDSAMPTMHHLEVRR